MKKYIWTKKSETLLYEALASDDIKESIINFELENFSKNQKGIDGAVENFTQILGNISNLSCKIGRKGKKIKKIKQVWSDNVIYETKKQINKIGNQIKSVQVLP